MYTSYLQRVKGLLANQVFVKMVEHTKLFKGHVNVNRTTRGPTVRLVSCVHIFTSYNKENSSISSKKPNKQMIHITICLKREFVLIPRSEARLS